MWMQDDYAALNSNSRTKSSFFPLLFTACALEIRYDAPEVCINTCALRGGSNVEILPLLMLQW